MPTTSKWSNKDERQYEHIVDSAKKRGGRPAARAKEIAARTVNKKRREEGRTQASGSKSGKSSNAKRSNTKSKSGLRDETVSELRSRAAKLDISGRSRMKKDELVRAIQRQS